MIVLTPATRADLTAVMALEQAGFDHAQWSQTSWAEEIEALDRHVLLVSEDDMTLGVATFQILADVVDLNRIVVDPKQRGRGLGKQLLAAGLAWAATTDAERMMLEVECDNAPALGLYRTCGFTEIARRRNYYGTGRDAVVMERNLA